VEPAAQPAHGIQRWLAHAAAGDHEQLVLPDLIAVFMANAD
jgi:hypothetical protein